MINLIRTDSENTDFEKLVAQLDADLKIRDGDDHAFYAEINKTAVLKYAVVVYDNSEAIGCGALKFYGERTLEIKRMYVLPSKRGQGIASKIIAELENWTRELGLKKCILETGINQPEAIALYKKCGYKIIANYGQYENIATSVCFEKLI